MKTKFLLIMGSIALLPTLALAGQQYCGNTPVADDLSRCPDGSIPIFKATEVQPYVAPVVKPYVPPKPLVPDPPKPTIDPQTPVPSDPSANNPTPQPPPPVKPTPKAKPKIDTNYFMGVWRTNVSGAVWESPSGYDGYNWLNVGAGISAGDLIIKPNHTYVWNSYGGKTGKWVKGTADYPVVLLDTVENRQWQLSVDPHHTGGRDITVWDGNAYYYDGRR